MKQYNDALDLILNSGDKVGNTREVINANLKLPTKLLCTSKRRLLSPYYLVGELMFSLDFSNELEFISYYSKFWNQISEADTVRSAYWWQAKFGYGFDQIKYVIEKLKADPNSRQAIIHLKHPVRYYGKDEICTLSVQFFIRKEKLQMVVNMRSNDVVRGLPYDHTVFVMLQSYIAHKLGIEIEDIYYHNAASFHLYDSDTVKDFNGTIDNYPIEFTKDFFDNATNLLILEKACRNNTILVTTGINLINSNFEDDITKTVGAIILMYKRTKEEKDRIMKEVLLDVDCGLTRLLIDYHYNLRK